MTWLPAAGGILATVLIFLLVIIPGILAITGLIRLIVAVIMAAKRR